MIYGGMKLVHKMVKTIGLDKSINKHLHLLKLNSSYHESDHVLNLHRCVEHKSGQRFMVSHATVQVDSPTMLFLESSLDTFPARHYSEIRLNVRIMVVFTER